MFSSTLKFKPSKKIAKEAYLLTRVTIEDLTVKQPNWMIFGSPPGSGQMPGEKDIPPIVVMVASSHWTDDGRKNSIRRWEQFFLFSDGIGSLGLKYYPNFGWSNLIGRKMFHFASFWQNSQHSKTRFLGNKSTRPITMFFTFCVCIYIL